MYDLKSTGGIRLRTAFSAKGEQFKQPVSVRFGVRTFRLNLEPKFSDFRYRAAVPEISGHWIASNVSVYTQTFFGTPKPEMWYFQNSQI